eukprot:31314-Pelagococcus_subviridis.AAC.33
MPNLLRPSVMCFDAERLYTNSLCNVRVVSAFRSRDARALCAASRSAKSDWIGLGFTSATSGSSVRARSLSRTSFAFVTSLKRMTVRFLSGKASNFSTVGANDDMQCCDDAGATTRRAARWLPLLEIRDTLSAAGPGRTRRRGVAIDRPPISTPGSCGAGVARGRPVTARD